MQCEDMSCIRMDVEGLNPRGAHQRVEGQIESIVRECMHSLLFFSAVEVCLFLDISQFSSLVRLFGSLPSTPFDNLMFVNLGIYLLNK